MKIKKEKMGALSISSITTKRKISVNGIYLPSFEPELQAALGATLSRDPGSAKDRLKTILSNDKIKKRIMDVYFKKYGHNSVGDMGSFIFSVEGLSMKGAVNLVENQLFNGQEASTRYLDFSEMGFLPVGKKVDKYSKELMQIYTELKEELKKYFIEEEGLEEKVAEPKAFDIAGAFLPISARTNVFWVGSIRTYITQIRKMLSLGDDEAVEIAEAMQEIVDDICPNSLRKVEKDYQKAERDFNKKILKKRSKEIDFISFSAFDLKSFKKHIKSKIQNTEALGIFGNITFSDNFDFRSARDVHRHRAFRVNTVAEYKEKGLEEFYLKNIPEKFRKETEKKLKKIIKEVKKEKNGEYAFPMAVKFPYVISGDLPAWLYFLNLRSGKTVHPTVVTLVRKLGGKVEKKLGLKNIYQRTGTDYKKRSQDKNKV